MPQQVIVDLDSLDKPKSLPTQGKQTSSGQVIVDLSSLAPPKTAPTASPMKAPPAYRRNRLNPRTGLPMQDIDPTGKHTLGALSNVGAIAATLPFGGEGALPMVGRAAASFVGGTAGSALEQEVGKLLKAPGYSTPSLRQAFKEGGIQAVIQALGEVPGVVASRFLKALSPETRAIVGGKEFPTTTGMSRPESSVARFEQTLAGTAAGAPIKKTYAAAADVGKQRIVDVLRDATGYVGKPDSMVADVGKAADQLKQQTSAVYKQLAGTDPNIQAMMAERSELSDAAIKARRAGDMKTARTLSQQVETQDQMIETALKGTSGPKAVQQYRGAKAAWNQAKALEDWQELLQDSVDGIPMSEQPTGVQGVPQKLKGRALREKLNPVDMERKYGSATRLAQAVGPTGEKTVKEVAEMLSRAQATGELSGRLVNVGMAMQGVRDVVSGAVKGTVNLAAEMAGMRAMAHAMAQPGGAEIVSRYLRMAPNTARAAVLAYKIGQYATEPSKKSSDVETSRSRRSAESQSPQ